MPGLPNPYAPFGYGGSNVPQGPSPTAGMEAASLRLNTTDPMYRMFGGGGEYQQAGEFLRPQLQLTMGNIRRELSARSGMAGAQAAANRGGAASQAATMMDAASQAGGQSLGAQLGFAAQQGSLAGEMSSFNQRATQLGHQGRLENLRFDWGKATDLFGASQQAFMNEQQAAMMQEQIAASQAAREGGGWGDFFKGLATTAVGGLAGAAGTALAGPVGGALFGKAASGLFGGGQSGGGGGSQAWANYNDNNWYGGGNTQFDWGF